MINDLDETIKQLLIDGVPLDINEIDVIFEAPTEEWSTSLARPTINCYLYHVAENYDLRQSDWQLNRPVLAQAQAQGQGQGQGSSNGGSNRLTATRRRVPFRMDAFYSISVWANEIEDEHRLLWRVIAALIRYNNNPVPHDKLKGELANQDWPVPIKVAQQESPVKNPSDFWGSMEVPIKPSISVSFTLPLDPDMITTAPLVLTRRLRMFQDMGDKERVELPAVQFGGWVLSSEGADGQPVEGADVVIVERGLRTKTDEYGRFKFDHVPNGRYTLRAIAESGQAERSIELPGAGYDLVLSASRPARNEASNRASGGDEPPATRQDGKGRRR